MLRLTRAFLACALAALIAGCSDLPAVFEDVGNDPHPPRLTLLGIGLQPPAPDPETPPTVTYLPPDAVVTVRPYDEAAKTLALRVAYADAGADLTGITVRDLDGPNGADLTLPDFPGTAGILEATIAFDTKSVPGPHRLEVWAVDGKDSRSATTSFTVTVEIF